jgi:hypothetical protein
MSAMRTSFTEPFALTRHMARRETFADWFDTEVRVSRMSLVDAERVSLENVPEMIMVRGADELSPVTAGGMAGAVAGPAMVAVATTLSARAHHAIDLPGMMARAAHVPAVWAHPAGWTMAVVMGAALGALFAHLTRRLRSFPPMIAFGLVTAFTLWTALQGLVLTRFTPWLAKMLPYGPMVIGAMVAGLIMALQVPIRTRRLL